MTESVTFITHFYERPEDGQLVWLLLSEDHVPTPAVYNAEHGDGKPRYLRGEYYSLLRGREHYPMQGDSWAPLTPPENANLCSPPPDA